MKLHLIQCPLSYDQWLVGAAFSRDLPGQSRLNHRQAQMAAGARKLSELYRGRWTIETAFQHQADYFNSQINTLGYPRAALFGFCVALVSYIILAVIKAALGRVHCILKALKDQTVVLYDEDVKVYRYNRHRYHRDLTALKAFNELVKTWRSLP